MDSATTQNSWKTENQCEADLKHEDRCRAVERRAGKVHDDHVKAAAKLDAAHCGTLPDAPPGPVELKRAGLARAGAATGRWPLRRDGRVRGRASGGVYENAAEHYRCVTTSGKHGRPTTLGESGVAKLAECNPTGIQ